MSIQELSLNGTKHSVLIRGEADAPVLLLVQMGPGFPMIHEADALEKRLHLERSFRVVYWDQRGTGLSFDASENEGDPPAGASGPARRPLTDRTSRGAHPWPKLPPPPPQARSS